MYERINEDLGRVVSMSFFQKGFSLYSSKYTIFRMHGAKYKCYKCNISKFYTAPQSQRDSSSLKILTVASDVSPNFQTRRVSLRLTPPPQFFFLPHPIPLPCVRKPISIMFKLKFTSYYLVIRENYLVIRRKDLVSTRKYLVITRKDLVITRKDLVITRKL